jgi:hypothetical protein
MYMGQLSIFLNRSDLFKFLLPLLTGKGSGVKGILKIIENCRLETEK